MAESHLFGGSHYGICSCIAESEKSGGRCGLGLIAAFPLLPLRRVTLRPGLSLD